VTRLVLAALLSVVVAFLLSAAEAAIWRMSRVRAHELQEEGRPGAKALVRIVADSAAYLSVTAFLRVVAESTAAVLITLGAVDLVDGFWKPLLVAISVMALVSFVVVGVSPRTLGREHSDTVALLASPVIVWLRRVLGPVARVLVALGNAVTPGRGYRDGPFQSESELRDLVDLAGESAVIEDEEREMIHSVFELGDTIAREVMVPRTDMVTIDSEKSLRSAMSLFLRSGFSRIPVVGDGPDDVLGLLYFKDVARRVNADHDASQLPVTAQMRPMHYVPESKPVDDLLREMQHDQSHFAMVVDEYGGTAGLVTIEDILEEIVGEIADEYDREAPGVEDLGDGRFRVPATMDIDDLADLFGVEIEEDQVDTVGGLIGKCIGRVPIVGSQCEIAGLSLTAERMAGRRHRIATVIVERVPLPDDGPSDAPSRPRATVEPEREGVS
jgi:CBS domain containing-hemolysin-like protein